MFRFVDRWQTSLAQAWNRVGSPNDELMRLLEGRDQQLEEYLAGATEWLTPTFSGTWVNFGSTHRNARFRKNGDRTEIEGFVKSGTIGTSIFTLPAGFRPPTDMVFAVHSNTAFGSLVVKAGGTVEAQSGSNVSFGINCSFSVTP